MSRKHPGRFHIAIPGPTNWISEIIIINDSITNENQSHVKILH